MSEAGRKEFAGGYTRTQRVIETSMLGVFFATEAYLAFKLTHVPSMWALAALVPALLVGFLIADFLSGMVHWFCDTWGSINWPIVGQSVLRTFREHHFDQKAITRHDFVETNGSNGFIGMVPMLSVSFLNTSESLLAWSALVAGCSTSFFVLMTSQIHKWSHSDEPPALVAFLQRIGFLLSPEHHAIHHSAPFTHHYCITGGWLNPIAERTRIFPRLERLITSLTGAEPRHDPLSDQLAAEVLRRLPANAPLVPAIAEPIDGGDAQPRMP